MSRFYIAKIAASGTGVIYSEVSFDDGINIMHGPSNSGKSYVIKCINFMFGGSSIPFSQSATGYDSVSMTMKSDDGYVFEATRKIEEGKTGDRGSSSVTVSSSVPGIDSDKYKIQDYSNLLLKLLGIDKPPQIISTERYATQALTIRTIFHFLFLDEDHIIRERTALDTPEHSKITASMTALYYLLTENNLEGLIPKLSDEEIKGNL